MYQSPVNGIAELVANAWDADATSVDTELPQTLTDVGATFVVRDDGLSMTFKEYQRLYLAVGRDRRRGKTESKTAGGRPVLGRKGIGKSAGFGIARGDPSLRLVRVSGVDKEALGLSREMVARDGE